MLYHLAYVSTQTRPMQASDLLGLLGTSRSSNEEVGITGVLLHRDDSFFQVLEGEKDVVMRVFRMVKADPRHNRIKVLFKGPIKEREFVDWRMGFLELDDVDISSLPGFSDFLFNDDEPRRFLESLTDAKRLMLLFRAMR